MYNSLPLSASTMRTGPSAESNQLRGSRVRSLFQRSNSPEIRSDLMGVPSGLKSWSFISFEGRLKLFVARRSLCRFSPANKVHLLLLTIRPIYDLFSVAHNVALLPIEAFSRPLSGARRHSSAHWKRPLDHFLKGGASGFRIFIESVSSAKRANSEALGRNGAALVTLLERACIREHLGERLASLD